MPILKSLRQHRILLDTHVWLWALTDHPNLTKEFGSDFQRILNEKEVLISPLSIWEIGMLVDKKRISIDMDVLDWVNQALEIPGMRLCPITPQIAIQSTRLPGDLHGDPVDRILISTAHIESVVLVTCDKKILEYGAGKFISVFNPCKNE